MNSKVGLIGCGKRAVQHVPGLIADERCEAVALADVNQDTATDTDYHELLQKEKA